MSQHSGERVRHKGPVMAHIRTTKDVARALRDLSGWCSYGSLLRRYGHVSRSMAAWNGWMRGTRQPTLARLLDVLEAFDAELVIQERQRPNSSHAGSSKGVEDFGRPRGC